MIITNIHLNAIINSMKGSVNLGRGQFDCREILKVMLR